MTSATKEPGFGRFRHPRYWGTWIALAAMVLSARLPLAPQLAVARRLGAIVRRVRRRPYETAKRNLEVCFPELDPAARERLLTRHFESLAASLVEIALAWCGSTAKLRRYVEVRGAEHLRAVETEGRGAILLAAHFTPIDIAVSTLADYSNGCGCMYSPARNAMLEAMMRRGRARFAATQIRDDDVRSLVAFLKRGGTVVYVPDQTYLGSQSALLPFFGEPAMTNMATSKLARITGARVLPYTFKRIDAGPRYVVDIAPPLEGFPTADARADTRRLVMLLEHAIRAAPEQYLWTYRKFKGRPAPLPDLYVQTP